MPRGHKTIRSHARADEKELLQELATAELATALHADAVEVLRHELQERQKRSSATLLRNKLSQLTLKREYQKI